MLVFVYGTLKRGAENHSLISKEKFVCKGSIYAALYDLGVDFPGAVIDGTRSQTYGEVYDVRDSLIPEIDKFEGYYPDDIDESLYTRESVTVWCEDKQKREAIAYILREDRLPEFIAEPLPKGVWRV